MISYDCGAGKRFGELTDLELDVDDRQDGGCRAAFGAKTSNR